MKKEYLSARESEPDKLKWMQSFPPPVEKINKTGEASFFSFPQLRYSACHMREYLPTINVSPGIGGAAPLEYAIDKNIKDIEFKVAGVDSVLTFEVSLWKNYTDGITILHKGKIVYERYFGCLEETGKHIAMSVTKSITGTLASILIAEGKLDAEATVSSIIPELKDSGFGDATVQQVMDMTTGIDYNEQYADSNSDVWKYAAAINPYSRLSGYKDPIGIFNYLKTIRKAARHGDSFTYRTVNADLIGWIISRITDKTAAQLLSDRIWSKIGMEQAAYYQVDALGIPNSGGGLNLGLRDMARFGQLMLNKGKWHGKQIIPLEAVENIMKGGNQEVFNMPDRPLLKNWSYHNLWWHTENQHHAYLARGIHGQAIYINPMAEMVLVRFASHPIASNSRNDNISLPSYQAVANYLIHKNNSR